MGIEIASECGTCGADLRKPGQWLECRAHYTERIAQLEGERDNLVCSNTDISEAHALAARNHAEQVRKLYAKITAAKQERDEARGALERCADDANAMCEMLASGHNHSNIIEDVSGWANEIIDRVNVLIPTPAEEQPEPMRSDPLLTIALFLWTLLDNIDTLDDACRDNDGAFRDNVRKQQKRRWEVGDSDGYTVTFKELEVPAEVSTEKPTEAPAEPDGP